MSHSNSVIGVGTKFACTTLGQLSEHPSPPCLSSLSSGSREHMEGTGGGPSMRLRVHLLLYIADRSGFQLQFVGSLAFVGEAKRLIDNGPTLSWR